MTDDSVGVLLNIAVVTPPVSVSFSFICLRKRTAMAYGCRMIRSVDDRLVADGWIACGCGIIDSGSDVVDGLVVNVISGSSNGGVWLLTRICGRLELLSWLELL